MRLPALLCCFVLLSACATRPTSPVDRATWSTAKDGSQQIDGIFAARRRPATPEDASLRDLGPTSDQIDRLMREPELAFPAMNDLLTQLLTYREGFHSRFVSRIDNASAYTLSAEDRTDLGTRSSAVNGALTTLTLSIEGKLDQIVQQDASQLRALMQIAVGTLMDNLGEQERARFADATLHWLELMDRTLQNALTNGSIGARVFEPAALQQALRTEYGDRWQSDEDQLVTLVLGALDIALPQSGPLDPQGRRILTYVQTAVQELIRELRKAAP